MTQAFSRQLGKNRLNSETLFTALVAGMVFLFCVLSIVYLSHANAVATQGYTLKQLQEDRAYLQAEVDTWNLKLTRLQALNVLSNSEKVAQMTKYQVTPQFIEKQEKVAYVPAN